MNSGDPLIGASNDKLGEILNYETQYLDYFVDNFQSNNDKIVRQMKNVMKEVVFDHFQLTEEKLSDYLQLARQTKDKLDGITEKLDLSATNGLKKLDYLITRVIKVEKILENNMTPQSNSEEDTLNNILEEATYSLHQNEIVPSENGHSNGNLQLGNTVLTLKKLIKIFLKTILCITSIFKPIFFHFDRLLSNAF